MTISTEMRYKPQNLHAVMTAISDLGSRFSMALEAMATRINKLEGTKSLLAITGHEKPSQSWRDSTERLPLSWADRDPEETFEVIPFTGWPDEEESQSKDPIQLHQVSDVTQNLLKEAFTTHQPNGSRLQVRKPYGLPQNDHSQPPKLDTMVKRRLGRNVKNQDTELSKYRPLPWML